MAHTRKSDLRNLDDFAEYLQNACDKNGIAPLTPFDSRHFAAAPDKTEFAAHHGVDILKLESRGIYSPDSDNSTYSRLLEEQLNREFWPSNNSHQLGLPVMDPLPEMGCDEQPLPVGNLPSSLSNFLQQTPPESLPALASLLLGGVARAKSRDPSKRPKDSFEPSSRKTKTGRREYAKAPTFQQWAQKAGIKLTWLSNNAVQEATKVFGRLLEAMLVVMFWPRHRTSERRRGPGAMEVPALEKAAGEATPLEKAVGGGGRVVRPGSITLDARRNAPARAADNVPAGPREPEVSKHTGELGKITLWLESAFVDYDPSLLRVFLQKFPKTTLDTVLDVARNMWRKSDGREGEDKFVNLQKFLHRLSAVDTLKALRPKWSADELQNFVYFELNHIYNTIAAGCQTVCDQNLDPYDLILKIPAMPIIIDMSDAELNAAVNRVLTTASRVGQNVQVSQYLEAIAVAVRAGGASKEEHANVVALAKEAAAADIGHQQDPPFALPSPLGVGGDTLYALQNTPFGLKSTQEMVKTAMRRGFDPVPAQGPGWVLPSAIGGGDMDGQKRKQALLRAQVEEAIREIRADYGVDQRKSKEVQEKLNENRRDVNLGGTRRVPTEFTKAEVDRKLENVRRRERARRDRFTE